MSFGRFSSMSPRRRLNTNHSPSKPFDCARRPRLPPLPPCGQLACRLGGVDPFPLSPKIWLRQEANPYRRLQNASIKADEAVSHTTAAIWTDRENQGLKCDHLKYERAPRLNVVRDMWQMGPRKSGPADTPWRCSVLYWVVAKRSQPEGSPEGNAGP